MGTILIFYRDYYIFGALFVYFDLVGEYATICGISDMLHFKLLSTMFARSHSSVNSVAIARKDSKPVFSELLQC